MPYSLNILNCDNSSKEWEGEEAVPNTPRRRFSISSPDELGYLTPTLPRPTALVEQDAIRNIPKSKAFHSSSNSSRIGRLLRERQLRRSSSCYRDFEDSESRLEGWGGSENFWGKGVAGAGAGLASGAGAAAAAAAAGAGGDDSNDQKNLETTGVDYCKGLDNFDPGGALPNNGQQPPRRAAQRLLVVANRLPVSASKKADNSWSLELSAGGLVSALLGVKQNFETRWIGWPGVDVPDENGRKSLSAALEEKGCIPVFLDEDMLDQYYNGYCNNVLWPLFHYIGLPQEDRLAATHSLQSQFDAYFQANKLFADVVFSQYQEGDIVWCHDYHLMFLPKCLKQLNNHMKVGWFLHTPFPSSEIYRTLPSRTELLKAVLMADLIGFHTYDYARHFVSACTRILGLEGTPDGVEDQGRVTRVAAFPIGIDPQRFIQALETEDVKKNIRDLQARFAGKKVMLGVDRLDMIKGIPQKLLAYEQFLEDNVEWRDKVLLVQIAVPTRTDVHEYQRLASQVHEIVGRICGRFGKIAHLPINYLDCSLPFSELCSLYAVADVVLVTSLRDGMNLVSYEFVACQSSKKGVLVLSEFAGAAQSLGAGAILINPWNISEVADSILDALTMRDEEREERHRHIYSLVTTHTAQAWADTFVSELNDTIVEAELRTKRTPPQLPVDLAVDKFQQSENRLLILGFNSTMTAHVEDPGRKGSDQIREMKLQAHSSLKEVLGELSADPKTTVLLLSGSARSVLDEAFSEYDMWLAAENGMFLRHTGGTWMTTMPDHLNLDWLESVQLVFEYFCERTPRSFVEFRDTSLVWNYKYADVEFGRVQSRDMLQHLCNGPISNAAVDVVQGSKSVEVRPVGVSKGAAIERILTEITHTKQMSKPIDFVMVLGHFLPKDEDVYTYFDPAHTMDKECCNNNDSNVFGECKAPAKVSERVKGGGKLAVSRAKSFPLSSSPDHNGWHGRGLKDKKIDTQAVEEAGTQGMRHLQPENYFSCAVGRKCSEARYSMASAEDVIALLRVMAVSKVTATKCGRQSPIPSRRVAAG